VCVVLRLTGSQYIVLARKHTERTAGQGRLAGLRVGIAAVSLSRGGAERAAAHWAAVADDHGADVRFFAVESSDESYALPERVSLTVAGKTRLRDTAHVIRALERFAASCDVIAAFQPYVGSLCVLARVRCPWLIVAGQDPRRWRDTSRMPALGYRLAFRRAAAAAGPSRGLIECHRAAGLRPRGDWDHIPNVVAEAAFEVDGAHRAGALFVGRLVPEKRPLLALRAAAEAGMPITFLGDGPLRATLVEEADRLGLSDHVRVLPFTRDPWAFYAQHRVLVLTSRYEAFANAIVESLAAGTPVVSVDCDFGPREILADARYSTLVDDTVDAVSAGLVAVDGRERSAAEAAECHAIAARYRRDVVGPAIADALRGVVRSGAVK
jgi:glycosyltransferase involved in cell wall biosynthesis